MLTLIAGALVALSPVQREPGAPGPDIQDRRGSLPPLPALEESPITALQSELVHVSGLFTAVAGAQPEKASATIFRTPQIEGGWTGGVLPVKITVTGNHADLVLKQLLERLGEKPAP